MLVFWFLVLALTAVLILLCSYFFGSKVSHTVEKIYNDFTEEKGEDKVNEQNEQ